MRRQRYHPFPQKSDQPPSKKVTREGPSKEHSQNRKRLEELVEHRKKSRVSNKSTDHQSPEAIQPQDLEKFNQDESDHPSSEDHQPKGLRNSNRPDDCKYLSPVSYSLIC
ncbi:uncharacterized protein MELLADRAFT_112136 [Melampsora larici-populina 98AG31]|uniref:Uncharacterized protein n=1 Tax=Melampsora larici-populina (strain 98AG31 / pathotype 3-4-7) TaxID=747676 RepID=F4S5I2_MELLP|nr:uncharacterized protein MELLADRAFT_112136 [Melampsora larici-populina 98AG31]EGG00101.1 hypothetical protein MELLADRAFT_112136 [Melampsora larici-populina 98AG31]